MCNIIRTRVLFIYTFYGLLMRFYRACYFECFQHFMGFSHGQKADAAFDTRLIPSRYSLYMNFIKARIYTAGRKIKDVREVIIK